MTYSPKSELVGVLSPSSINTKDIGVNWKDLGVISGTTISTVCYLGNGTALIGNSGGEILRSVDYGNTWTNLGTIAPGSIVALTYIGNGIVIFGSSTHIWRSIDFGITWTDLGVVGLVSLDTISYLGNGIVIAGDASVVGNDIYMSTDFGATWAGVTDRSAASMTTSSYIDNGIVLMGDSSGHIFRSTDYGLSWSDSGPITTVPIKSMAYLGNGIVNFVTDVVFPPGVPRIFRSNDFGLTWNLAGGAIPGNDINTVLYIGNGIAIIGDAAGRILRCEDFGKSFINLGVISGSPITVSAYLGNGVVIVSSADHIFHSDISYKTNESQVNYPRIPTDVTALRGLYTVPTPNVYTNLDQTRSLLVCVSCNCQGGGGAGGVATFQLLADTVSPPVTDASPLVGINVGLANEDNIYQTTGVVKPGYNYRILPNIVGTGTVTLVDWFEMYI